MNGPASRVLCTLACILSAVGLGRGIATGDAGLCAVAVAAWLIAILNDFGRR